MTYSEQAAKHFRDVHFGGNWTFVNLRDTLADVTWQQAVTKVHSFNTIAALAYHIHYFVEVVLKVLQGGPLQGSDSVSFDVPPITSEEQWQQLLTGMWRDAEAFANLLEKLPDDKYAQLFAGEKYGTWFRNVHGIIEHTHYHMGQIVIIKKLVQLQGNLA